ncbi:TPA: hypothetical protein ROY30_004313 [Bacillus cereus]|uniref:DUF6414 family protein n=1 Tax=Bacillales TaxID=1385 RepID=UPI0008640D18|nr:MULTISPECIES: hypothetical protein [Bacillales]MCP1177723.1 hypothetical protein [Bacillus sp. 1663tsa1]MCP1284732.1 hypothetical protein [Bacillus sp. S0635]MCQ6348534.1 hypothetical protein [Bacillus cereus]MCU5750344.1 hypothetical protein [Bacillus cereus]SCM90825.1 A0A072WQE1 (Uncharacterized protein) [Bacillus cereus]
MFIPELYYCDRRKVEELLSMLLDNFATEYKITQSKDKKHDVQISAEVFKVLAKYNMVDSTTENKETNVKSTNSSLFKDLYTLLNEKGTVQSLIGYDEGILKQLKTGEFVEVEGVFKQSPAELVLASSMDAVRKFQPLMEMAPSLAMSDIEPEKIQAFTTFFTSDKTTMIIDPEDEATNGYKFFTTLKVTDFIEDRYEIEGQMRILGKVRKIIRPLQSVDLIKLLPGRMRVKPEELIEKFMQNNSAGNVYFDVDEITEESFVLKGPAIEITPIAVYI